MNQKASLPVQTQKRLTPQPSFTSIFLASERHMFSPVTQEEKNKSYLRLTFPGQYLSPQAAPTNQGNLMSGIGLIGLSWDWGLGVLTCLSDALPALAREGKDTGKTSSTRLLSTILPQHVLGEQQLSAGCTTMARNKKLNCHWGLAVLAIRSRAAATALAEEIGHMYK